ncbi:MAG: hypothetical protein VX641_04805 [Planctomycetota bacterium]|nr:hypothetical protein [Planctomycetota bacterium]
MESHQQMLEFPFLLLLAILAGFLVSTPLVWWLIRLGRRASMLDSAGSDGHRKQLRAIPNIGGIGIFLGAILPLVGGVAYLWLTVPPVSSELPSTLDPTNARILDQMGTWIAIIASCFVLHVMGVIDDRKAQPASLKLLLQFLLGAMLVLLFDVRLLHVLDEFGSAGWITSCVLTILWLVVITNAFNFLDNMDGLAAGVATIAATVLMIATTLNNQWFISLSLALLIGALLGFLIFNFPPARVFMGDGGSLVIGWLLAIATVRTTFVDTADPGYALGSSWYGVFIPLVVLAVPLYDFTSVVVIRTLQGRSPFVGDQQHFSHRLVQRGLSPRRAVLVIWAITLATGVNGIVLGSVSPAMAILLALATLVLLAGLALLESGLASSGEAADV